MNRFFAEVLPDSFRKLALVCISKQLEALNFLIGRVFASFVHDIRGPISTMVSMMEILDTLPYDKENPELIHEVRQRVDDTFRQIDKLFGWLNNQNYDTAGINISVIIESTISETDLHTENIQKLAIGRDAVVLWFAHELPKGFLERLFWQAVKIPGCGGWISVQVLYSAQGVIVSVKDTGIRIDPEKAKFLFEWIRKESFRTVPDDREGLRGCLITQDNIMQENSKVILDNPKYTLFYFAIPISK